MVTLNQIVYNPQEDQYITAAELATFTSQISANFVLLNNAMIQIIDNNIYSGSNTFNGTTVFSGTTNFNSTINVNGVQITSTATKLNYNDITTLGTIEASKTVTANASKDVTGFRHITLTGNIVSGATTLSETDLAKIDAITNGTQAANKAVVTDTNVNSGISKNTQLWIGVSGSEVQLTATPQEINEKCDLSAQEQTLTVSGAITAGKTKVYLNHASTAIASTIANTTLHQQGLIVKCQLEPGSGQDHTCTITTGTWNGTNKIATFADINDAIVVDFDNAGNGTVIANIGTVVFSG